MCLRAASRDNFLEKRSIDRAKYDINLCTVVCDPEGRYFELVRSAVSRDEMNNVSLSLLLSLDNTTLGAERGSRFKRKSRRI